LPVNVFVTGTIRSGTTFVGRALASADNCIYLHEPFNPDSPWNAAIPTPINHFYISEHNAKIYEGRFNSLLKLRPAIKGKWLESHRQERTEYIEKAIPKGLSRENLNIIIKDPIALFCTEWLADRWGLKPVLVVRDPRDVVNSIFRLSWAKNLQPMFLRTQPLLVRRLKEMEEQLGLSKCISTEFSEDNLTTVIRYLKPSYLALLYFARISKFQMLCYERSTLQPDVEFLRLFDDLSIPMSDTFKSSLSKATNTFDASRTHQNTYAPVSVKRIKQLRDDTEDLPAVDDKIIIDAFAEIRSGFAQLVDWWE